MNYNSDDSKNRFEFKHTDIQGNVTTSTFNAIDIDDVDYYYNQFLKGCGFVFSDDRDEK